MCEVSLSYLERLNSYGQFSLTDNRRTNTSLTDNRRTHRAKCTLQKSTLSFGWLSTGRAITGLIKAVTKQNRTKSAKRALLLFWRKRLRYFEVKCSVTSLHRASRMRTKVLIRLRGCWSAFVVPMWNEPVLSSCDSLNDSRMVHYHLF